MKREPMGHEREDGWLGTTLRRSVPTASDDCIDAETLAAWADGGLSAKAAAAVEMHASSCSRCMTVLAAMERTAPAPSATHAWTPARLFRWAAPLAAAATAVAIWVIVPDRPMTPVESTTVQDLRSTSERLDERAKSSADSAGQVPVPVPRAVEPRTLTQDPAPSTKNQEPKEEVQFRDELRRERAAAQDLGAAAAAAPEAAPPAAPPAFAPEAPPVAPPAAPAPQAAAAPSTAARSAAAPPAAAADSRAETAAVAQERSNFSSRIVATGESIAPSNALMRWRVVQPASVERSSDGGKTWTKTTLPAPNVVSVRAVDADRAVATTSDKTQFYTANAGRSWTRVQENSAAPF